MNNESNDIIFDSLIESPILKEDLPYSLSQSTTMTVCDKIFIEDLETIRLFDAEPEDRITSPTDYALTCGCNQTFYYKDNYTCSTYTRSPFDCDTIYSIYGGSGVSDEIPTYQANAGIRPCIKLNPNSNILPFNEYKNHGMTIQDQTSIINKVSDKQNRKTIFFGNYPNHAVDENMNNRLEGFVKRYDPRLVKTGKQYVGYLDENNQFVLNDEYEYCGDKYVRAKLNCSTAIKDKPLLYSDSSTRIRHENPSEDIYYWHKVEPIEWEIVNWDHISSNINPEGTDMFEYLELRSLHAIQSGIPFEKEHLKTSHVETSSYYQNSAIRAFLNGTSTHKEIIKGNGVAEFSSTINYDFKGHGFLDTAFTEYQMNNTKNEIINNVKKKKSKFGITIKENPMTIDDQIKFYMDNRLPFMLHGKSGIGKSRRISDICPNFVSLTLRNGILPEEIIGKDTTDENGVSRWTPPSYYTELIKSCEENPDKNIALFIDELTNVNEHEQSIIFDIILNNSIKPNKGKLPDNCIVVAAGNSKDESEAAYNMPEPLFRRFHGHIYIPLDLDSFLEWGNEPRKDNPEQTNIHPLIARFLAAYSKALYTEYDAEKEGENFAIDPRGWEQVSDIIYHNNGEISRELLQNKIGFSYANTLIEFAKKNFITIEDIMEGDYKLSDIPVKLDEQYALALSLKQADEHEIEKVRNFIADNLSGETLAKFDFAWTNNNPEKALIIGQLQEKREQELQEKAELEEFLNHHPQTNKAITIQDFCGSKADWYKVPHRSDIMAIRCNSEEKAKILCKAFGLLGYDWPFDGTPCYDNTNYDTYKHNTCYTNTGEITSYNEVVKNDIKCYEMRDIDFSDVLISDIKRLTRIEEQEGYKRIIIEDFCGSSQDWENEYREDVAGIHCNNSAKAKWLGEAFDKLGHHWVGGSEYNNNLNYSQYNEKTVYYNTGRYGDLRSRAAQTNPIYDFSEVDFSSVFSAEKIEEIEETLKIDGSYNKYSSEIDLDLFTNDGMINIKDFCVSIPKWYNTNRSDKMAVYCSSKEDVKWLFKALNRLGMTWTNLTPYVVDDLYVGKYITNSGFLDTNENNLKNKGYKILRFDQIDFTGVLKSDEIEEMYRESLPF